jgi:hypothetical protein
VKKSIIRTAFLTILCTLTLTSPLYADEIGAPTPLKNAKAILVANNVNQTMDTMFSQLVPVMEAGFIGQLTQINGGNELIKKIDDSFPGGTKAFGKRFGELMMAGLRTNYDEIIEKAAHQYVAEIAPADLAAIRAFMESPTGQSMIAAQPKIQQQMSSTGGEIGRRVGEEAAVQLMVEAETYFGKSE